MDALPELRFNDKTLVLDSFFFALSWELRSGYRPSGSTPPKGLFSAQSNDLARVLIFFLGQLKNIHNSIV